MNRYYVLNLQCEIITFVVDYRTYLSIISDLDLLQNNLKSVMLTTDIFQNKIGLNKWFFVYNV